MHRSGHKETKRGVVRARAPRIALALIAGLLVSLNSAYTAAHANADGSGGPLCPVGEITNVSPPTLAAPNVGDLNSGATLTLATNGSWSGCGVTVTNYKYQWVHDDGATPILGQGVTTSPTQYVLNQSRDAAHLVDYGVKACDDEGDCSNEFVPTSNYGAIGHVPRIGAFFDCGIYQVNQNNQLIQPVYTDSQRNTVLQHLADAQVSKVRMSVTWVRMVDTPGYLLTVKKCADMIASYGMSVVLTFNATPSTEQGQFVGRTSTWKPPDDCLTESDLCTSVSDATQSLTQCLLAANECNAANTSCSPPPTGWPSRCALTANDFSIEVWNEPNITTRFIPVCYRDGRTLTDLGLTACPTGSLFPGDNWESLAKLQYYHVLRGAWQGVKAANASVTVVGGSAGQATISAPAWISDLYGVGAKAYMDIVSMHPYPTHTGCPTVSTPFSQVSTVFQTMQSHGDPSKAIWFTEFGWSNQKDANNNDRCPETPSNPAQSQRASEALTFTDAPHNVRAELWWLSDRTQLRSPWGTLCNTGTTAWECGEALLNDDLTAPPTTSPSVYATLQSAPQN